jgi:transposase
MRAGFDRLSLYIRERMKASITDGDLYIFLGKNRRRLKAIYFDGTGVVLINKRLERGYFMRLSQLAYTEITEAEFDLLFCGSVICRSQFGKSALTIPQGILQSQLTHASP